MKKGTLLVWFTSTLLISFGQPVSRQIDSLLHTYYASSEPGACVAIEQNGKVLFEKGYGLANLQTGEKINPQTNFNIGSITKQFTGIAILQLVKRHQLSLDDKLIHFFPGFSQVLGNQVTVQQLLTHSSGLMDHYPYVDTQRIKHAVDKDVLEAVRKNDSSYFVPGTRFRYSNTAYCLLGMIIEKVSGLPYSEYIQKNIFTPLGMTASRVLEMGQSIPKRAFGYDTLDGKFQKLDAAESIFFSTQADGGIYTSVAQYLLWFHALQQGSLLPRSWVDKARSAEYPVEKEHHLSYGYGWFVNEEHEDKAVYHTGSNGGFRAFVFTIPSKNYVMVIFSNRTGVDLEKLGEEINKILRITDKSYLKIDALESFNNSCPIFAAWKEIS